jgi:hypothetical protein
MKYRFDIMTNHPSDLEIEVDKFNFERGTDLKIMRIIEDEVTFVELETSITNELLFEFGVQFGKNDMKRHIEGRI